jgi:O-antigen/teichoic acid export membrane protein
VLRIFLFNLSGRLVLVAISLISIPIYVHYIGVSNYGIVGIYTSLATLASVFDVVFSNTINRELARRGTRDSGAADTGAVFRTLEVFTWVVATTLAALLVAASTGLVTDWIGADKYAGQNLIGTVRLMGLLLLLQAPVSFYSGCLYGLHRHGLINGINVFGTAVSSSLTILTLAYVAPTIDAFFVSQFVGRLVLTSALAVASYVLIVRDIGWRSLHGSLAVWRSLWRFAAGMNGIGLLNLLANQADMVFLSRWLPATPLGYYTIARTVSQSLVTLAAPAYQSAFPQLSRLVGTGEKRELVHAFHRFCQFMALVVIPPGIVICVFSKEVLALWTHNLLLANDAWLTLSLLSIGSMFYGLNYMISALQLANGALRAMVLLGVVFVSLVIPALLILVHLYAQAGAALAWLAVNVIVIAVGATWTLRRYMAGEFGHWLFQDMLLPVVAAVLPVVLIRVCFSEPAGSDLAAVALIAATIMAFALTIGALPEGRTLVRKAARYAGSLLAWR